MRIQSIDRAIAVLNLFRSHRAPLSLGDISTGMGLAKTTIHTIVKTLEYHGFLFKDPHSKKYSLGFSLFELGMIQAGNLEINRVASKMMHELANDLNTYCRLAIWNDGTVFVTMTVHPQGRDTHSRQLGPRLPAYCTALGKAILAHLPERMIEAYLEKSNLQPLTKYSITDRQQLKKELVLTKSRGYAISHRETLLHQIGVAAPIYDGEGKVVAAASVQLHPEETNEQLIENRASRLMRTTCDISMEMGYKPLSLAAGDG